MILADDVNVAVGTGLDRMSFGSIGRLAKEIRMAERFVLDRQTVGAVMGVSHSSPKSIMSARSFARAPFEKVWIEWRFQDVLDAIDKECRLEKDRFPPERVGCLVEVIPHRPLSGMMTLAWKCNGNIEQSIFCHIYDLGDDAPDLDLVADHFVRDRRLFLHDDSASIRAGLEARPETVAESTQKHLKRDRSQIDHLVDELSRFDFVNNPRTLRFANLIQQTQGRNPIHFLRDWEREGLTVISSLILMNSRDLSVREPVTQAKLNKKRQARGKPLLQPHTVVRLGVSMGVPRGGSHAGSKAHVVRGHFKVRQQGVFWWNPHVRGDGRLAERSAYEVRA